jgi:hypothetical protein
MAGRKSNGGGDQGQLDGRNEESRGAGDQRQRAGEGGAGGIKVRVAAKFVKRPRLLLLHIFLDSKFRLVSSVGQ